MKVKDLISILSTMDQEAGIVICREDSKFECFSNFFEMQKLYKSKSLYFSERDKRKDAEDITKKEYDERYNDESEWQLVII